ncbi:MAG: hypothetical protein MI975_02640 [Cytophagales bacterium]|nr:hypothetical protein [Cytophagales bacterium]
MAFISKKKLVYSIKEPLREYLVAQGREVHLPITYEELHRFDNAIPFIDNHGKDTLWETVLHPHSEMLHVHEALKKIYAHLKSAGDVSVIEHLYIDRIDLCTYGNTKPFRIRIVNKINDLFDYFYIKTADASRVYGLELEHLISPNKINFLVCESTLVEEHIQGIPGDDFIKKNLKDPHLNIMRLSKEFIKFNERCLVRLLGDMHSSNFVVEVIPDFDEIHYRIRAIDFDQQAFEARSAIYMPQYFKQNNPIIKLGMKNLAPELEMQYQKEERSLIANRLKSKISGPPIRNLVKAMMQDEIAPKTHVKSLRQDLSKLYNDKEFLACQNMGEILYTSLKFVFKYPIRHKYSFVNL